MTTTITYITSIVITLSDGHVILYTMLLLLYRRAVFRPYFACVSLRPDAKFPSKRPSKTRSDLAKYYLQRHSQQYNIMPFQFLIIVFGRLLSECFWPFTGDKIIPFRTHDVSNNVVFFCFSIIFTDFGVMDLFFSFDIFVSFHQNLLLSSYVTGMNKINKFKLLSGMK